MLSAIGRHLSRRERLYCMYGLIMIITLSRSHGGAFQASTFSKRRNHAQNKNEQFLFIFFFLFFLVAFFYYYYFQRKIQIEQYASVITSTSTLLLCPLETRSVLICFFSRQYSRVPVTNWKLSSPQPSPLSTFLYHTSLFSLIVQPLFPALIAPIYNG